MNNTSDKLITLHMRRILHYSDPLYSPCELLLFFQFLGTGKTATFAIGILQTLDVSIRDCQALVLAPTRELAQQIVKVIMSLGDFMNIRIHACVGGTAVREDIRTLQDGVHVVVGTPGRVYDMIQRRALRLDHVRMFTLDEADEMLSRYVPILLSF